jgi:hypothetical protein
MVIRKKNREYVKTFKVSYRYKTDYVKENGIIKKAYWGINAYKD